MVVESMIENLIFLSITQIHLTFILLNHEYKLRGTQTLIKKIFVKLVL